MHHSTQTKGLNQSNQLTAASTEHEHEIQNNSKENTFQHHLM